MKILSLFITLICIVSFAENPNLSHPSKTKKTQVQVVELSNYSFNADNFFEERKNLTFRETTAEVKFQRWGLEAIDRVNDLIPSQDRLDKIKLKLIFQADIQTSSALIAAVPVSIIDSYQEPKTLSIRLGMLELKDDETSFKITVAHEYSHLILENASRMAGTTPATAETIQFWSKPIYEGAADLMASMAFETHYTGSLQSWGTRDLFEYVSLDDAQNAKDSTVVSARAAFQKMNLIPKFQIYENWLETIEKFIQSSGGKDPYAEGSWFAGSLYKIADNHQWRAKLAKELVSRAKSGEIESDTLHFYEKLKSQLVK